MQEACPSAHHTYSLGSCRTSLATAALVTLLCATATVCEGGCTTHDGMEKWARSSHISLPCLLGHCAATAVKIRHTNGVQRRGTQRRSTRSPTNTQQRGHKHKRRVDPSHKLNLIAVGTLYLDCHLSSTALQNVPHS